MWFRIIGAAIGGFFTSIWSNWFHDRGIRKAEDEKLRGERTNDRLTMQNAQLTNQVQAVEKADETRDQVNAGELPADVAQLVQQQYVD